MRRSSTLALLTCLVLPAGAVASPGRASDFEDRVALGAPERPRAVAVPGGPVITPVQRAPRRFDLLGLRWSDRRSVEIEVRTRRDGHRFGPWTHVEDADAQPGRSDPVWTGAADAYQLRLSRPPRGLRAHFVRVRGDPRARTAVAPRTVRQLGSPAIVPRSEWGGDQCAPRRAPATGRVDVAFVHHTVTAAEYGPQDSAAMVLAICRYHQGSNGWDDIGYNFLVDRFGRVFEGRAGGIDQAVVGAHTQGFNALSTGVANLGTFEAVEQTPEALASLSRLLAWKLHLHGTPVQGTVAATSRGGSHSRYPAGATATLQRISGHRDGGLTACPGAALYLQLPQLRTLAVAHAATLPPPATLVTPLTP
nr:peptidoglycan recognition protein [Solirubrobacterales bacterium]